MGVLSWRGLVTTKFSPHPLAVKLCIRPPKVLECKNVLEVLYHHAKSGGARISPAAGATKNWVFLFVCLSVCPSHFWTSEFVHPISPWRRWTTEMILLPLDRGMFVFVHLCSTFSDCCQLATPLNAKVQQKRKNWGFSPPEGDNKPIGIKSDK